ncbi:hypothetical protein [Enterocloster asparagiformis]|uniref:hypothetical protein n=1 Tax=Enterocloster asparagiformis TaxID=333367 RepID=UPI002A80930B|nr:hypothetical protein [Enterocloster asparagiformis]
MKKSIFGKIGAAAVVLTLVTSSLVGGTFAKYVTNANGTAAGTVARWGVTFKNGENEFVGDNAKITLTGKGGKNTILPGDKGNFTISLDGSSADVGFTYTINIKAASDDALGNKLVFYSDDTYADGVKLTDGELTDTVGYDATTPANMKKEITVYWQLPESTGVDQAAIDAADTELAGKLASYDITMKAEQVTTP